MVLIAVGLADQANPYPVIPSWEDWQFPHDTFPSGENDDDDVWPESSPVDPSSPVALLQLRRWDLE